MLLFLTRATRIFDSYLEKLCWYVNYREIRAFLHRLSLVFHSIEKMTSLFIHLYPPITFCAMRHFMPEKLRDERFPAIGQLPTLDSWTAFAWVRVFGSF